MWDSYCGTTGQRQKLCAEVLGRVRYINASRLNLEKAGVLNLFNVNS